MEFLCKTYSLTLPNFADEVKFQTSFLSKVSFQNTPNFVAQVYTVLWSIEQKKIVKIFSRCMIFKLKYLRHCQCQPTVKTCSLESKFCVVMD